MPDSHRSEGLIAVRPPDAGPVGDDFAAWVGPHLAILAAIAVREVGTADADDVVQEALTRAWRRRSTFRAERGSVRGWLVTILMNQARRHRLRRPWSPRLDRDRPLLLSGPDARLDVEQAVQALPRRQREVVTLHYLADLPLVEVAAVLGISIGSVKSHLFDARAALRTTLEKP